MKFGIAIDIAPAGNLAAQMDRAAHLSAIAEANGVTSLWLGESFHRVDEPFHAGGVLGLLASLVPRCTIDLGTGVLLVPAYDPQRLAQDVGTLQALSGGRLRLGVGLGAPGLRSRLGIGDGRKSGDVMDEFLHVLYDDAPEPKLLPTEHGTSVPLLMGGLSRRAQGRVERYDCGVYISTNSDDDVLRKLATDNPGRPVAVNRICVIDDVPGRAHQTFEREYAEIVGYYRARGIWNDVAPAPGLLVGTPDEVLARLTEYESWGVTDVQLRVAPARTGLSVVHRTLNLLGSEVEPQFRDVDDSTYCRRTHEATSRSIPAST